MGSKFYVYGGGRWRELDTERGCVSGWGRVAFVYQAGGRLVVARRRRVLRALRTLADGKEGAARAGAPLREYKPYKKHSRRLKSPKPHQRCLSHITHVMQTCTQCDNVSKFDELKESRCSVGVQCKSTVEVAVQTSQDAKSTEEAKVSSDAVPQGQISNGEQVIKSRDISLSPRNKRKQKSNFTQHEKLDKCFPNTSSNTNKLIMDKRKASPGSSGESNNESQKKKSTDALSSSRTSENNLELNINDVDLQILQRFFEKNKFGVDPERFKNELRYKMRVLFSINPLVQVERSALIQRMLHENRGDVRLPLENFMKILGMQTVGEHRTSRIRYRTRLHAHAHAGEDKENETEQGTACMAKTTRPPPSKKLRRNLRSSTEYVDLCDSSGEDGSRRRGSSRGNSSTSNVVEKKKPLQISQLRISRKRQRRAEEGARTGSSKNNRAYSEVEDRAIVAWLVQGDRAILVNGNRVWRDLQEHHAAHTGIKRSWHSLRNRYLRYILPSLGRLTSPPEATRLRSAASTGELKRRKRLGENSMLALPPVRSAWARGRRVPVDSPERASPPAVSTPRPTTRRRTRATLSPTLEQEIGQQIEGTGSAAKASPNTSEVSVSDAGATATHAVSPRLRPRRQLYNHKVVT